MSKPPGYRDGETVGARVLFELMRDDIQDLRARVAVLEKCIEVLVQKREKEFPFLKVTEYGTVEWGE